MESRFVSIWFRYLSTDWFSMRNDTLRENPFVLRAPSHGRMVVTAVNAKAEADGLTKGMALADARALLPDLEVMDDDPNRVQSLLNRIALWCIRFTPFVALDPPDGLIFDASGCTYLWGGDEAYLTDIRRRFNDKGFTARLAIADTPGAAWALARFGKEVTVVPKGKHLEAILSLPPEALRLEESIALKLHKLGLHQIHQFIQLPRQSLRRRFGPQMLVRIDQVTGVVKEHLEPVRPVVPYQERLPCIEPVSTYTSITTALQQLLITLCERLRQDQMGIRKVVFKSYRVDGQVPEVTISTSRPTQHVSHLFKLFEPKLGSIDPGLGIELFVLEALQVDDQVPVQEDIWHGADGGLDNTELAELVDRLAGRIGDQAISRFLPEEHYWPERSFRKAASLQEKPITTWRTDKVRPVRILSRPERIEVTAPIPDYPPMLFRYKGKLHKVVYADGPERIEQEWWLQQGQHRDYYTVEDESGCRYWIFRLGHYDDISFQWFLHGFFA